MEKEKYIQLSRFFSILAIIIALYNAYNTWFKDNYSPYLTIFVLLFVVLAISLNKK